MARHENLNVTNLTTTDITATTVALGGASVNRNNSTKIVQCVTGTINYNVATPFTVDLGTVPSGATILYTVVEVVTAFNAVTTNVLVVGNATTDNAYVVAADVNEAAAGTTVVGKKTALTAATLVKAKYTQTGTAATAGQAVCSVFYSV